MDNTQSFGQKAKQINQNPKTNHKILSNESRKSILKIQPRYSYAHHFSFHSQITNFSNKSKYDKENSYNEHQMKYIHEAFKAFREMPDNSSSEFAKAVSDKIKKSEYYPLAGLMKKIGSPKRNILIKPYLLKDDEIEDNNLKNSKNLKENFKKKIYEKIETMQKDLGSLINEVNFKKNNEKKEFHKNYQVAKEKEDHSDMSNFINAKEKIFNRTKKNLHVVTLNFDETENLLVIGLINCEIRVQKKIII